MEPHYFRFDVVDEKASRPGAGIEPVT